MELGSVDGNMPLGSTSDPNLVLSMAAMPHAFSVPTQQVLTTNENIMQMDHSNMIVSHQQEHLQSPSSGLLAQQQPQTEMVMDTHAETDSLCVSMLSLAEQCRSSDPPQIQECIHFLEAVVAARPSPSILARAHMNLGSLLMKHGKNSDLDLRLIQDHLKKSLLLCSQHPPLAMEELRFEAASLVAETYQMQNDFATCRMLLQQAMDLLPEQAYFWHCRLMFQLSQVHMYEKDYAAADRLLHSGAEIAERVGSVRTQVLFLLSRAMVLIAEANVMPAYDILTSVQKIFENWTDSVVKKEELKIFFLSIQVLYFISHGQAKNLKSCLKQLQISIQTLTSNREPEVISKNHVDYFYWMTKEYMCILVFIITVIASQQAGELNKALKYIEKGLEQIDKTRLLDDDSFTLQFFQALFLECSVCCQIVSGVKSEAIKQICQICAVCSQNQRLMHTFEAQIHTMLGLYAMSIPQLEASEAQFNTALRQTDRTDLWLFNSMNLAMVYLRSDKEQDFYGLLHRIAPDRLQTSSHSLKAAAFYVRGLQSFLQSRYHEAKKFLRETLRLSNEEDLDGLSCCALVLLGHIFLSVSNFKESMKMVQPALKVANKVPDLHVQIWATALMKDLYRLSGDNDQATKMSNSLQELMSRLKKDQYQATQSNHHTLLQWTDGPCPVQLALPSVENQNVIS